MDSVSSRERAIDTRAVRGLMVSALSFGTMTLRDHGDEVEGKISRGEEAYELLEACYKGGVNFFDCAVSVRPASAFALR